MKDAFQKDSDDYPVSAAMRQLVSAEPAQEQAAWLALRRSTRTTGALLLFMMRDPVKRMRAVIRYAAFSTALL